MNLRRYLIFVSGPLTQGNTAENVKNAHNAGVALVKAGFSVIIPHDMAFWGNIAASVSELTDEIGFITQKDLEGIVYETAMENCFEQVKRCDAVLRLPGHSPGGDREVKLAVSKGIHVFHSVEEVTLYFTWLEKARLGA